MKLIWILQKSVVQKVITNVQIKYQAWNYLERDLILTRSINDNVYVIIRRVKAGVYLNTTVL
jgi:hypothetical protein